MDATSTDETTACFVGVRAVKNAIEIHAVNSRSEVVLQGWFSREVGIALIGNRPASVIAVDGGSISDDVVSELEDLGHSTVVITSLSGFEGTSARSICSFGLTLSDKVH